MFEMYLNYNFSSFFCIFQVFTALLKKERREDKILAPKAIKNSGLANAVTELKAFITDDNIKKNLPYVRIDAVLAFSRLHKKAPTRGEVRYPLSAFYCLQLLILKIQKKRYYNRKLNVTKMKYKSYIIA